MRRIVAVLGVCAVVGGCTVNLQEARGKLETAIASAKQWSALGARVMCEGYSTLAAAFETVALAGVVNETTVRDVRVAVQVLDTSCPEILAGNTSAVRVVTQTYVILMKAASDARAQAARSRGV